MSSMRLAGLACGVALGLASGIGVSACGEDRGGVEVEGGTTSTSSTVPTTGTTGTTGTPTQTTTTP